MQKNYIALIPAYKPSSFLLNLVHQLNENGFYVVVVDDGSGAEYEKIFLECAPYGKMLHHIKNAGKGRALKTGFSYIAEHFSFDSVVVTVDADGQHRVDDALAICRLAEKFPNTLVLGSRKLKRDVPFRSRLGNTVTRLVYHITTGLKVYDTQTGLRAFSASLIPKLLEISGDRYEYEMNVLLRFAREKIKIQEYEIETIYIDHNAQSHFNAIRDSLRIYKEILKFSASSFISFLVDYAAYSLLILLTGRLWISNVAARVISASVNFLMNRKFVFKSKETLWKLAVKYFLLAAGILVGNTLVLELLVTICGIHRLLAKIITEILFFTSSWLIQRLVVFKKEKTDPERKR